MVSKLGADAKESSSGLGDEESGAREESECTDPAVGCLNFKGYSFLLSTLIARECNAL